VALRIALFDNDNEFLETRTELLKRVGFTVYTASSLIEARKVLEEVWIHVAVLDIRLENDRDEGDISGLDLARDARYQTIPKIIVTNYPTYEQVVTALGPRLRDLPPAVDFLAKKGGAEALVDAIKKAANTFTKINWSLKTHWGGQGLSYAALAGHLNPSGDISQLVDGTAELEDLFRVLFSQYTQITIQLLP